MVGPLFVSVTVNVTLVPTAGVALLTVLVTARFASGTSTDAEAALFAPTGSCVVADTVAVFVTVVWVVTAATTARVALAPFVIDPTVQAPAA